MSIYKQLNQHTLATISEFLTYSDFAESSVFIMELMLGYINKAVLSHGIYNAFDYRLVWIKPGGLVKWV